MTPIEMISVPLLKLVVSPRFDAQLELWVEPLKKACERCEMNTIRRVAAFIAQMAHESDLKPRTEYLNYSVQALLANFSRIRISVADAMDLGRTPTRKANQEAIANVIYGGEWGRVNLGNTKEGDGWLFRGRGPLQVTGRRWMEGFAEFMGLPLDQAIAYADTLEGGIGKGQLRDGRLHVLIGGPGLLRGGQHCRHRIAGRHLVAKTLQFARPGLRRSRRRGSSWRPDRQRRETRHDRPRRRRGSGPGPRRSTRRRCCSNAGRPEPCAPWRSPRKRKGGTRNG